VMASNTVRRSSSGRDSRVALRDRLGAPVIAAAHMIRRTDPSQGDGVHLRPLP
jgi:hypothetical protein